MNRTVHINIEQIFKFKVENLIYYDLKKNFLYSCSKKGLFFVSSKELAKILQKLSYSLLSIILSCKNFRYNLSKDLVVF